MSCSFCALSKELSCRRTVHYPSQTKNGSHPLSCTKFSVSGAALYSRNFVIRSCLVLTWTREAKQSTASKEAWVGSWICQSNLIWLCPVWPYSFLILNLILPWQTLAHHLPSTNLLSTAVVCHLLSGKQFSANAALFHVSPKQPELLHLRALKCSRMSGRLCSGLLLAFFLSCTHSAAPAHCTLKSATWTHARKFCKWDMDAWSEGLLLKGTNFTANKLMRNSCILSQLPWCAQQWTRRPPLMLDVWWQCSGKEHIHGIQSYTESWRYFATSGMHCLSPVPLQRKEPKWM